MFRRWAIAALLAALALAASASAAPRSWPPAHGPGLLFVHYGEEHWNDDDSDITLPKVVRQAIRYRPDLVTMSADKANDGTVEQLTRWKRIMSAYDRAGIPYLAATGNHDRTSPPGFPTGTAGLIIPRVEGSLENYKRIFADRPYPFGDGSNYAGIGPRRPRGDPAGASSHYFADIGNVRWIFLDNSCWGIADCDAFQNPPFPHGGTRGQFEFLERRADQARDRGRHVFVVMHMGTRDPRDQSYIAPTSFNHVMGKGLNPFQAPDNHRFERVAERSGVDAVFVGHIKGQWQYRGEGGIPYYVDGGAGGELYSDGAIGVDHGYWHGFRVIRVAGGKITTDVVPILSHRSIRILGPRSLRVGRTVRFAANGVLRKEISRDVVVALRDPYPISPDEPEGMAQMIAGVLEGGGWLAAIGGILLLCLALQSLARVWQRLVVVGPAFLLVSVVALSAVAIAQRSEPTTTPKRALPNPARIWTSSNPHVLAPVTSTTDDPRRNRRTQTNDGMFRARCPGRAVLTITSGFERARKRVVVRRRPGAEAPARCSRRR